MHPTGAFMTLNIDWFIRYKFFNSLFLGLSVGAIFTIYGPLKPSLYSIGGIALAVGMLIVARLYHHILNIPWFYRISLLVELVLMGAIIYFLLFPYTYQTALLVYAGYQITFVFGSYLIRVETLIIQKDILLTSLDTAKQLGYLIGMGGSWVFYKIIEQWNIIENQEKVYYLHFLLLCLEIIIISLILKSFAKEA